MRTAGRRTPGWRCCSAARWHLRVAARLRMAAPRATAVDSPPARRRPDMPLRLEILAPAPLDAFLLPPTPSCSATVRSCRPRPRRTRAPAADGTGRPASCSRPGLFLAPGGRGWSRQVRCGPCESRSIGPLAHVAGWRILLNGPVQDDPVAADQRAARWRAGRWAKARSSRNGTGTAPRRGARQPARHRYPQARITHSLADIDPAAPRGPAALELDSGPPPSLRRDAASGQRHPSPRPSSACCAAGVVPAGISTRACCRSAQRRLLETGRLRVGVRADRHRCRPGAAPVEVSVREAKQQKLVLGIGASTDSGGRPRRRAPHHRVPGLGLARHQQAAARARRARSAPRSTSPVDPQGWHWNLGAQLQRRDDGSTITTSEQLKAGCAQGARRLRAPFYLQYDRAQVQ